MNRLYPAYIHKSPESSFTVSFPDLPGCISAGDTLEEAIANAGEALALHADGMTEEKLAIPAPSTLEAAIKHADSDPEWRENLVTVQLVPVSINEPAVKLSITMPADLVRRIDAAAGSYGRSGFIADACRERLRTHGLVPVFDLKDGTLTRREGAYAATTAPRSAQTGTFAVEVPKAPTDGYDPGFVPSRPMPGREGWVIAGRGMPKNFKIKRK